MNHPEQREDSGQSVDGFPEQQASSSDRGADLPISTTDPSFSGNEAWLPGELVGHPENVVAIDWLLDAGAQAEGSEASEELGELLAFFNNATQAPTVERENIESLAHTSLERSLSSFRAAVQELPAMHVYAENIRSGSVSGGAVGDGSAHGRGVATISELASQLVTDVLSAALNENDANPSRLEERKDGGIWQIAQHVRETTSVIGHDDGLSVSSLGKLGTIPADPYGMTAPRDPAASSQLGSIVNDRTPPSPSGLSGNEEKAEVGHSPVDGLAASPASEGGPLVTPELATVSAAQQGREAAVATLPAAASADMTIPAREPDLTGTIPSAETSKDVAAAATDHDPDTDSNVEPSRTDVVYVATEETMVDYGEAGNGPPPELAQLALELLNTSSPIDLAVFADVMPSAGQEAPEPTTSDGQHGDVDAQHRDGAPHQLAEEPTPSSFDGAHEGRSHDYHLADHQSGPIEDHPPPGLDHS
jgi:hypothetical protein